MCVCVCLCLCVCVSVCVCVLGWKGGGSRKILELNYFIPNSYSAIMVQKHVGKWRLTPVLLPGKSMGRGAWWAAVHGVAKSQTWLSHFTFTFYFSLSCIGEGNGNPLQCSCLENPRHGGAWWAAIYGVTQSRTWLKWLSSSSSRFKNICCLQYECLGSSTVQRSRRRHHF